MSSLKASWPDLVKGLAIIFVVLLHTSARYLYKFDQISSFDWYTAHAINSLARVSVPLFVLASGALLLHKSEPWPEFISKRVRRVVIPWLFWGIVLIGLRLWIVADTPQTAWKSLVYDTYTTGFWFIPMIISLYVITPGLRMALRRIPMIWFYCYVCLWFVLAVVIPTMKVIPLTQLSWGMFPYTFGYSGYYLLGYFLVHRFPTHRWLRLSGVLLGLGYLLQFVGPAVFTQQTGRFIAAWYDYTSLPSFMMSLGLFIVCLQWAQRPAVKQGITSITWQLISRHILGVYFVHLLFLRLVPLPEFDWYRVAWGSVLSDIMLKTSFLLAVSLVVLHLPKVLRARSET